MGNAKYILIGASAVIIVVLLAFAAKTIFSGDAHAQDTNTQTYSTNTASTQRLASGSGDTVASSGTTAVPSGNVQQANLALINFKYTLTPNKLVKGIPVRIAVDASTLSGCMTTVVIKDFGIIKHIISSDNIIEFTPDKTGTFWITCSMGMGPGSFEVVNADGTPAPATAKVASPPPSSGGSCGAGGGGCGCGG
ncbi:MAG: hypothetical protein WC916_00090 [Candidatus Woesearchaeota archaeon]